MKKLVQLALFAAAVAAPAQTINVTVDANAARKPIDPRIYGVAFATTAELNDLNATLNRSGGNAMTRHNWKLNTTNRGGDWFFQNFYDLDDAARTAPEGQYLDNLVLASKAGGAEPMITIPMIGWAPNTKNFGCSFMQQEFANQDEFDFWHPECGNGKWGGARISDPEPQDLNMQVTSTFWQELVQHFVARHGGAKDDGVKYYFTDNEASIWFGAHWDIAPVGVTMEDFRDRVIDYAGKVKDADPDALILGPEEWGWSGYIYSGYDMWYMDENGWTANPPDRVAHGGADYIPWLLGELKRNYSRTGRRPLDMITVHIYPQNGEFSNAVDATTQGERNRSTRQLWDPTYRDESWIQDYVQLIPRMKQWSATNFPNTPIGITEYNWGAETHMNGATAQADILGIFGREGLDLATRWVTPESGGAVYNAFKLYRNYDGARSTFGDVSISTSGFDANTFAAYSALRSIDGAMTLMLVNKSSTSSANVAVSLAGWTPGAAAQVYRLSGAGTSITTPAAQAVTTTGFSVTVPAQSITLYVIPASNPHPAPVITSLTESSAPPSGGTTVTVNGANFENGSTVTVAGVTPQNVTYVNSTAVTFTTPSRPAGSLADVSVRNINTMTTTRAGALFTDFHDVPSGHNFHDFIEKIFRRGITVGCGSGNYCPSAYVTRAQMAVFLLRALYPADYTPLPPVGNVFSDVPASHFAAAWIEQLAYTGITAGCGGGRYCPDSNITRGQMAVFLLAAKHGLGYVPPPAVGVFTDVPTSSPLAPWIEQLYNEGITSGCGGGNYCPGDPTTRGQMAVFLTATFGL